MKISTILDHIDSGHIALPEFQRGYVWNRDQVRGLCGSLYKRHPVVGWLVGPMEPQSTNHSGEAPRCHKSTEQLNSAQPTWVLIWLSFTASPITVR
jgi:hypothetical protein